MNRVIRIKVAERSPNGYSRMDEKTFDETHWEMKADIIYAFWYEYHMCKICTL